MGGDRRVAQHVSARLTAAEGRRFGLTVGGAFVVLTAVLWWRDHPTAMRVAGGLGLALLAGGLLIPSRLTPVHRFWMWLAERISRVTTPIVLGILYFGVITPIGLVLRAFGRGPLTHATGDGSMWVPRQASSRRSDLRRQF